MKPQIQLDPELLKHYREKKYLTQTDLADQVIGKPGDPGDKKASRLSTYHFIEKTGRTSPDRAKKIALALGCTVQDLQNPTDALDRPWWVEFAEPMNEELGVAVLGFRGAVDRIEQEWPQLLERRLERGIEVIAKLITDEKHYRLEVRSPDIDYVWKADFCACIMNKETGLRWDSTNKWEREFLKLSIKDLLFSHADSVLIDEERYPLLDKDEAIQSTFSNEIEDFRLSLGSPPSRQYFSNWHDFYESFRNYCKQYSEDNFLIEAVHHGIRITLTHKELKNHYSQTRTKINFVIKQGSINGEGNFEDGPFPKARINQHIKHLKQLGNIFVFWGASELVPVFGMPSESTIADDDDENQSNHGET